MVLLFFVCLSGSTPIDGVVAVVGDRIILKSDLLQQAQHVALGRGVDPIVSPVLFRGVVEETFESMVDRLVLLVAAKKDTTLFVSSEEVSLVVEEQVQSFIQKAGSQGALEKALGSSLRQIKADYRKDVFDMLLSEKFKSSLFGSIGITKTEVISFYNSFKDSLPLSPPEIELSFLETPIEPSLGAKDSTMRFLLGLAERVVLGEGFDSLAKQYSDDPGSASQGGDLGWTLRGEFVKEFEVVAFSLSVGEISQPFWSPFGLHIVKLEGRQGEKIHTKHILKRVFPTELDRERTLKKVDAIFVATQNDPGLFDSLAVEHYSKYKNNSAGRSRKKISSLPSNVIDVVLDQHEFSLSKPFRVSENSYALVYVYNKVDGGVKTLDGSWSEIKGLALYEKQMGVLKKWLAVARLQTFIKKFEI